MDKIIVFWFRRDLRLHDNHALYKAFQEGIPVLPVFIFDKDILTKLNSKNDARVTFIYSEIHKLKLFLQERGSSLRVFYSTPYEAFRILLNEYLISSVYANKDYEPYGRGRDDKIAKLLSAKGMALKLYKDHVIFEENEIIKDDGKPYTIYTPYSKKWKKIFFEKGIGSYPSEQYAEKFIKTDPFRMPLLSEMKFSKSNFVVPPREISETLIRDYAMNRDFPAVNGTSHLGIHLRFGTVSIRELTGKAKGLSDVFLNEIIWRDFFCAILWHFPAVAEKSFDSRYDFISWRNDEAEFDHWRFGQTGFPIVDAGMRELLETGFMHNRVRMVTSSFLAKQLLIDWRWGEAWFAQLLLDFELSSNNGNWQWAAGSGCDAAPYFRIFNPDKQQKKFDPDYEYVKKWVPEFNSEKYPRPVIDHSFARQRALECYKKAIKGFSEDSS